MPIPFSSQAIRRMDAQSTHGDRSDGRHPAGSLGPTRSRDSATWPPVTVFRGHTMSHGPRVEDGIRIQSRVLSRQNSRRRTPRGPAGAPPPDDPRLAGDHPRPPPHHPVTAARSANTISMRLDPTRTEPKRAACSWCLIGGSGCNGDHPPVPHPPPPGVSTRKRSPASTERVTLPGNRSRVPSR